MIVKSWKNFKRENGNHSAGCRFFLGGGFVCFVFTLFFSIEILFIYSIMLASGVLNGDLTFVYIIKSLA